MDIAEKHVDSNVGPNGNQVGANLRVPTARQIYLSSDSMEDEQREALERQFFSSIRLRNGTYKYTYSRRLDDLNLMVNELLPHVRPLLLMDVGISSGVSTLEWINSLNERHIEHHMIAGDQCLNVFLVSLGKHLHALVDGAGYPLQFEVIGKSIPNPPGGRNLVLYLFPILLMRLVLALRFRSLQRICSSEGVGQYDGSYGLSFRKIALVSPRLCKPANLTLVEDDILSNAVLPQRFHALRAANILNKCYFDDASLQRIILNLRNRLVCEGLLIVCRTNEYGANNGTVFTLNRDGSFEATARLGAGSEIEDLVLRTPLHKQLRTKRRPA